jgi:A/G-specific adenine glycosylase
MSSPISKKLLVWYGTNKRDLPWRGHPDPYHVWVSEIMAQQTRLETVIPFYRRWIERFPDIQSLARAELGEALVLWEGLGYYSRARNLHRAAQEVVDRYGGELPQDIKILRKLPGIGRYTAGAIASLAFGQDEPLVDGNVKRVLARLYNLQEAVDSTAGEKRIWTLAGDLLPSGKAADFNQALMDLGALVCMPRSPDCTTCPLASDCQANRLGLQEKLPHRKPNAAVPHHIVTGAVIRKGDKVLLARRPPGGLLGGMWEFPGGKQEEGEDLPACLQREIHEELGVKITIGKELGVFRHAYTHFKVTLHAFECHLNGSQPTPREGQEIRWARLSELADFPMGKIDRQISNTLIGQSGGRP